MAVPPRENYTRWQPTCFRFHERDFAGTRGRACRLILSWARISTAPSPSHPFFLLRLDPSPFIFPANLLSRVEKLSPRAAHSLERRKKKWMDSGLRLNNRTCSSGEEVWGTLNDSRVISSARFYFLSLIVVRWFIIRVENEEDTLSHFSRSLNLILRRVIIFVHRL